ncbi:MAG: hypothetical protein GX297_06590 [Treponema sp.]|jgi:hypothetical protein|nr:hypothetical protein [Treponema sp.]
MKQKVVPLQTRSVETARRFCFISGIMGFALGLSYKFGINLAKRRLGVWLGFI